MTGNREKNWLIRTKNFQILGPVSKEKILDFIEKGSLKGDDEISRGNGYWFAINEKELLEKHIYGDVPQGFNPISEARTVLATEENLGYTASFGGSHEVENTEDDPGGPESDEDVTKVPSNDDLAYPDEFSDDITLVTNSQSLSDSSENKNVHSAEVDESPSNDGDGTSPVEEDLEYPGAPVSQATESGGVDEDGEEIKVPGGEDLEYPNISGEEEAPVDSSPQEEEEVPPPPEDSNLELGADSSPSPSPSPEEEESSSSQSLIESDELDKVELPSLNEKEEGEPKSEGPKTKSGKKSSTKKASKGETQNDRYLLYLLIMVFLIIIGIVYYYLQILNRPLPLVGTAQAQTIESLGKKKT